MTTFLILALCGVGVVGGQQSAESPPQSLIAPNDPARSGRRQNELRQSFALDLELRWSGSWVLFKENRDARFALNG